jgi:hypothetical protein
LPEAGKNNIKHFFHTFKRGKQEAKQEYTYVRFKIIIRLRNVKLKIYNEKMQSRVANYNALTI